jgi:hypothetical protein
MSLLSKYSSRVNGFVSRLDAYIELAVTYITGASVHVNVSLSCPITQITSYVYSGNVSPKQLQICTGAGLFHGNSCCLNVPLGRVECR